jgi:alpha-methylacyl-CoA racemase
MPWSPEPMSDAPLAGLRILDLTRLLPGPLASMHLADYGADVIKLEDSGAGDYLRDFAPQVADGRGGRVNPTYEALNRGKRSIVLDLKHAQGRDAVLRLIDRADALLESFRPGVLERLGLGWDLLHARNPRLVLCSITGYGQSGPLSQAAGHDLNYAALAGVLDQNRAQGRPAIPNLQLGDVLGGALSALSALLIALFAAQRSGHGRRVDVSMADGLLMHQVFPRAELDAGVESRAERTLLTGGVACYRVYETADGGHLAVGALELKFWQNFCAAAGLPELKDRHWTLGEAPGSDAAQASIAAVAARLAQRSRAEWESVFAAADACVSPVLSPAEAAQHPQFLARGLHHRLGEATAVGPLASMSEHRFAARPAPRAGEHTVEILREAGYDAAGIDTLLAAGAAR